MLMEFKNSCTLSRIHIFSLWVLCGFGHAQGTLTFDPFSPASVSIPANTDDVKKLGSTVRCSESDSSKICTCTVNSNTDPFETWWLKGDSGYYVWYDNSARLTPGRTYNVKVDCKSNNEGSTVTQSLTVQVPDNLPPVIANYNKDTATIDAKATKQYDKVYTVRYSDPEKDAVTFSMTQNPNYGHFIIGVGDGIVRANVDMRRALADKYTLTITANDSYNLVKDFVLTVSVTNRNSVPQITNLPTSVTIDETAKKGDVILDLVLSDPDIYVDQDPVCAPKSSSDKSKFLFDMANNRIEVAYDNALNYETESVIIISCSWSDGYITTSDSEVLTVNVKDINEPPVWSADNYYCDIDEGNAAGPTCSLGATVQDPEGEPFTVDVLTANNQKFFKYDPGSDLLTFSVDYDLDQGGYASDVTAIMTATDSKGLSSTATVKIHVNDINDNKCQTDPVRIFKLDEQDEINRLGMFSGKDADATAPNNDIHFEVASADPSTTTDHIMVTRNGEIFYTNLFPPDQVGGNFKIIVLCVDAGMPRQTATTTVVVTYTVPTTTVETTPISTTTTEIDIWKLEAFQATFGTLIALIGLGLILLLGSLIACCCARTGWRYCCNRQLAKPAPSKQVSPYQPPTQRSLPPIEHGPSVNDRWENTAWSQNDKYEGTL